MDCKGANNGDSSYDKVIEPLSRLFTNLVEQLKLLIPSVHGSHRGTPTYDDRNRNNQWQMDSYNGVRWQCNETIEKGRVTIRTAILTGTIKHPLGTMDTNIAVGLVIKATS